MLLSFRVSKKWHIGEGDKYSEPRFRFFCQAPKQFPGKREPQSPGLLVFEQLLGTLRREEKEENHLRWKMIFVLFYFLGSPI